MFCLFLRYLATASLLACLPVQNAAAHEFWIEPEKARVAGGEVIRAELKVGRMLSGETLPFLGARFERFTVTAGGTTVPVTGLDGNLPAVSVTPQATGLHILAHQTVPFRATYDGWDLFGQLLEEEDYPEIAIEHRARGLDRSNFAERYTRFAKALVPVGPLAAGARDRAVGMEFELVAETLPFAVSADDFTVQLRRGGQPVSERRVSLIFDDGARPAERLAFETDAQGRVDLPVRGAGKYLVSAVMIEPAGPLPVVWHSLWASLAFRLEQ